MTDPSNTPKTAGASQPIADLSGAVLPTEATLRQRRSIPIQVVRFVVFNARMLRMVLRGGH